MTEKSYSERLAEANASIKTTNIKGKDYAEVNERIRVFWGLFPNGRILTRKTFDDLSRCDFECEIYRDAADELPAATGNAFETKTGAINSTSYIENCETSAIGRALGIMGIGNTAVASAEEVQGAIAQQDAQSAANPQKAPKRATTQKQPAAPATAPQSAPQSNARVVRIVELKAQAMAKGVPEYDLNKWFADKFGDRGINRLSDDERLEAIAHLEEIVKG